MSKKATLTSEKPTIEVGKPIALTTDSREDMVNKLHELRVKAREEGLIQSEGGFIGFRDGLFETVITFVKP